MALTIHDVATNQTYSYKWQDAVVDGDIVYLGRVAQQNQTFWRACNVNITATAGDWVIMVRPDGSKMTGRNFFGYIPIFQRR